MTSLLYLMLYPSEHAFSLTFFRARLWTKPFTNRVRRTYVICYKNYGHSIVLSASNLDLFTVLTFKNEKPTRSRRRAVFTNNYIRKGLRFYPFTFIGTV